MGNPRIDAANSIFSAGEDNPPVVFEVHGVCHLYFDHTRFGNRCRYNSRQGFKRELRAGNAVQISKTGDTPSAVAAHFRHTAIGVVKPPSEIDRIRILDQNHAVGAHRHFSAADADDKCSQS